MEAGVKQSGQGRAIRCSGAGGWSGGGGAGGGANRGFQPQQQLCKRECGQVASAMENIKQASAQNLSSARQLEAAARNLNELGAKLKHLLVERYKV